MDCLEFRRLLGSDPRNLERAAHEHLESCAFCTDAHARAQAFEARLAGAMAVAVPDGLADRILLAQLTSERQHQRVGRSRIVWIALAAAACMALAIGVVRYRGAPAATLSDLVAEHVTSPDESDALLMRDPVPADTVRHAFADRGVTLASVPSNVAYVSECGIGTGAGKFRSVHMVMPENGKPVSVVYVVQHRASGSQDFKRNGMVGRMVPIAQGTLVMLAQDAGRFDTLEHTWRNAIEGSPDIAAGSR
jgi:hypothetical protein